MYSRRSALFLTFSALSGFAASLSNPGGFWRRTGEDSKDAINLSASGYTPSASSGFDDKPSAGVPFGNQTIALSASTLIAIDRTISDLTYHPEDYSTTLLTKPEGTLYSGDRSDLPIASIGFATTPSILDRPTPASDQDRTVTLLVTGIASPDKDRLPTGSAKDQANPIPNKDAATASRGKEDTSEKDVTPRPSDDSQRSSGLGGNAVTSLSASQRTSLEPTTNQIFNVSLKDQTSRFLGQESNSNFPSGDQKRSIFTQDSTITAPAQLPTFSVPEKDRTNSIRTDHPKASAPGNASDDTFLAQSRISSIVAEDRTVETSVGSQATHPGDFTDNVPEKDRTTTIYATLLSSDALVDESSYSTASNRTAFTIPAKDLSLGVPAKDQTTVTIAVFTKDIISSSLSEKQLSSSSTSIPSAITATDKSQSAELPAKDVADASYLSIVKEFTIPGSVLVVTLRNQSEITTSLLGLTITETLTYAALTKSLTLIVPTLLGAPTSSLSSLSLPVLSVPIPGYPSESTIEVLTSSLSTSTAALSTPFETSLVPPPTKPEDTSSLSPVKKITIPGSAITLTFGNEYITKLLPDLTVTEELLATTLITSLTSNKPEILGSPPTLVSKSELLVDIFSTIPLSANLLVNSSPSSVSIVGVPSSKPESSLADLQTGSSPPLPSVFTIVLPTTVETQKVPFLVTLTDKDSKSVLDEPTSSAEIPQKPENTVSSSTVEVIPSIFSIAVIPSNAIQTKLETSTTKPEEALSITGESMSQPIRSTAAVTTLANPSIPSISTLAISLSSQADTLNPSGKTDITGGEISPSSTPPTGPNPLLLPTGIPKLSEQETQSISSTPYLRTFPAIDSGSLLSVIIPIGVDLSSLKSLTLLGTTTVVVTATSDLRAQTSTAVSLESAVGDTKSAAGSSLLLYPDVPLSSPNPVPTVVPLYSPEHLGNAYGGGFITPPSVYVTLAPTPSVGVPPGYRFSIIPEVSLILNIPTDVLLVPADSKVSETPTPSAATSIVPTESEKLESTATISTVVPKPEILSESTSAATTETIPETSNNDKSTSSPPVATAQTREIISNTPSSNISFTVPSQPSIPAVFRGYSAKQYPILGSVIFGILAIVLLQR